MHFERFFGRRIVPYLFALFHLPVTCHQSSHIPPPAESRGGWPLSSTSIRHSPPAESFRNQVGRLTLIFSELLGPGSPYDVVQRMPLSSALQIFWCVVWFHGTCGIQTSRRVSADYIWPELRRFPIHPPVLPYPNRGVVWRPIQSVFTRLLPHLSLVCLPPQDMCICMLIISPSPQCGLSFPPEGMRIGIRQRLESPLTCSYIRSSLDQYLSTDSSV